MADTSNSRRVPIKGEVRWAGEQGGSGTLVRGGGCPTAQIIAPGRAMSVFRWGGDHRFGYI